MEIPRSMVTALVTAYARAYHALYDENKIFDDYLAPKLYTADELREYAKNVAASLAFFDPALAAAQPDQASALATVMRLQTAPITLSRSRYTEELLDRAIETGVRQYVLLGAGLDTFAFRKPELLETVQVVSLDHPVTQAEMRRRVAAQGWHEPDGLVWVPIDFSTQDTRTVLAESAYDPRRLTLFSWLGVTYYLPLDRVTAALQALAKLAPAGSLIVFDYLDDAAFDPARATPLIQRVQAIVRNVGEPMLTGFEPGELPAYLSRLGWRLLEDIGPAEIQARYFAGRTDGYHAFEHIHFAYASIDG